MAHTPIREQINAAGFRTQREFAEHVGMSEEHVSRLVSGTKQPTKLLSLYLTAAAILQIRALTRDGGTK